jgi:hypothetical protein
MEAWTRTERWAAVGAILCGASIAANPIVALFLGIPLCGLLVRAFGDWMRRPCDAVLGAFVGEFVGGPPVAAGLLATAASVCGVLVLLHGNRSSRSTKLAFTGIGLSIVRMGCSLLLFFLVSLLRGFVPVVK